MEKKRVKINICGTNYNISSTSEEESYMISIGKEVDEKLSNLMKYNPNISITMAAVLLSLDYCDENKKLKVSYDENKERLEESNLETEILKEDIEELKSKIKKLELNASLNNKGKLEEDKETKSEREDQDEKKEKMTQTDEEIEDILNFFEM